MAKILVTGSEGYIGKHLVEALKGDVYRIDKVLGSDILDGLTDYYDLVYHLAAQTDVQTKDPTEMVRDNVLGTIEVAKLNCPIIFTSTAGVYGDDAIPASENDVPRPENTYAITKLAGEIILKGHTILRLGNVYGKGGKGVFEKLKTGKINGDGKSTRDYVHIDDVIEALLQAPHWPKGIYNIGTGIETSVNQVADILGVKKVYSNAVPEQRRSCLDISKVKNQGWSPKKWL